MRFITAILLLCTISCGPSLEAERVELERMAGQMIMCGFRGTGEAPLTDSLLFLLDDISRGKIGGVIYFDVDSETGKRDRNIVSLEQTKRLSVMLQRSAPLPLFIGVDQEGGRVRRFKEEHGVRFFASAKELGAGSSASTYREGAAMGAMLASVGVNVNFAPCLDVDVNPRSPAIGLVERSFSPDPGIVAEHGKAFAAGLYTAGVLPVYKHFPGHGSAAGDTHLGLVDITATWRESELLPYREVLSGGPPAMVMVGHIVHRDKTGEHPATLSPDAVGLLLRRELGWQGVVVTDDLQMKAINDHYSLKETIRLAVLAGGDILLFGNNLAHEPDLARKAHANLVELVQEGAISRERIEESYRRILALKKEGGILKDN